MYSKTKHVFRKDGGGAVQSTLVETVSINYEDFNESFLTCSTCLCNWQFLTWMNLDNRSNLLIYWQGRHYTSYHELTANTPWPGVTRSDQNLAVRWIWRRRSRTQTDSLLPHCLCLLSPGLTTRISLLAHSFLCRGSLPRTPASSGSGNWYFCGAVELPSNYFCLQMPDMSGTHKNPTWWSPGFPALIYREPADRSDGSPDQRGCTELLSPSEPGPDTP